MTALEQEEPRARCRVAYREGEKPCEGRAGAGAYDVGSERCQVFDPRRVDRHFGAGHPGGLGEKGAFAPVAVDQHRFPRAPMIAKTRPGKPAPDPRSANRVASGGT